MEPNENISIAENKIDVQKIIKALNQRPIAYYPIYRKLMGSVAGGVLLSQIMYRYGNLKKDQDEFDASDDELRNQTGLSEWELKTEKNKLRESGFVEINLRGVPAKTHYMVDIQKLAEKLSSLEDDLQTEKNNSLANAPVRRTSSKQDRRASSEQAGRTVSKHSFIENLKNKRKKSVAPKDGALPSPVVKNKKGKKYHFTETHMKASKWFYECLKKPMPDLLPPKKFDAWANDFRMMMEIDKREKVKIIEVVTWLTTSPHKDAQFWITNVQCPASLRDKFSKLSKLMDNAKKSSSGAVSGIINPTNGKPVIAPWQKRWNPLEQKGLMPNGAAATA